MKKIIILSLVCSLWSSVSYAAIVAKKVNYEEGGQKLQGVLYYDNTVEAAKPGVMVFHEWMGLGDYAKKRAVMLAKQGYAAFAVDMYGQGVFAKDHEEAAKLSGVFFKDREKMRLRAKAALDVFIKTGYADEFNISAIGYCFGGTAVLEMARAGFPLKGVVSFHGILATPSPAEAGAVKAKVLVFNGAEDAMISAQDIQTFQEEMRKAGADWQFVNLGGAKHSFTVWGASIPEKGIVYNEIADKRSWFATRSFLNEVMARPALMPILPKLPDEPIAAKSELDPILKNS